jgi:hypothetical protein
MGTRKSTGSRQEGKEWAKRLLLLRFLNVAGQPIKTLIQAFARSGTRALNEPGTQNASKWGDFGKDMPVALTQRVQSQFVRHLSSAHGIGQVLLVGENKQDSIAELIFRKHFLELITGGKDDGLKRERTEPDQRAPYRCCQQQK